MLNYSFQVTLGVPQIDRKKSRQNVLQVFTVYRQYKAILHIGLTPLFEPARPEYEDAVDPGMIHGSEFGSREPGRHTPLSESQIREWMMVDFIKNVDNKVSRLRLELRDIIQLRYLTSDEPQPTDTEVWMKLVNDGTYMSERDYERKKSDALMKLAYAFNVVVHYEENER